MKAEEDENNFPSSPNKGAFEGNPRLNDFPKSRYRKNYEILPIQELRKLGEKLGIKNFAELNKQKLIEEIHKRENA